MKKVLLFLGLSIISDMYGALTLEQYVNFQKNPIFAKNFDESNDLIRGYLALQYGSLIGQRQCGNIKFGRSLMDECSFKDKSDDAMTELLIMTEPSVGSDTLNASGIGSLEKDLELGREGKVKLIAGMLKLANDVREHLSSKQNTSKGKIFDIALEEEEANDYIVSYLYNGELQGDKILGDIKELAKIVAEDEWLMSSYEKDSDRKEVDRYAMAQAIKNFSKNLEKLDFPQVKELTNIQDVRGKMILYRRSVATCFKNLKELAKLLSEYSTYVFHFKKDSKVEGYKADIERIKTLLEKYSGNKRGHKRDFSEIKKILGKHGSALMEETSEKYGNLLSEMKWYTDDVVEIEKTLQQQNHALEKMKNYAEEINREDLKKIETELEYIEKKLKIIREGLVIIKDKMEKECGGSFEGLADQYVNSELEKREKAYREKSGRGKLFSFRLNRILKAGKACSLGSAVDLISEGLRKMSDKKIDHVNRKLKDLKSYVNFAKKEEDRLKVARKLANVIVNAVKLERLNESESDNEEATKYVKHPYYRGYVNDILCAYAWKVLNKDDLPEFADALREADRNADELERFLGSPTKVTGKNEDSTSENKHKNDDTDNEYVSTATNAVWKTMKDFYNCMPFTAGITPITSSRGQYGRSGNIPTYSDCMETTMRQLFCILVSKMGEGRELGMELKRLPENSLLRNFFEKQGFRSQDASKESVSEIANDGSEEIRKAWGEICSKKDSQKIKYLKGGFELSSNWETIITLFCLLMKGYDANDGEEVSEKIKGRKKKAAELIAKINDMNDGFVVTKTNKKEIAQEVASTLETLLGIRGDVVLKVDPNEDDFRKSIGRTNGSLVIFPKNFGNKDYESNNRVKLTSDESHAYVESPEKNGNDPEFKGKYSVNEESSGLCNVTKMVHRKKIFMKKYPIIHHYNMIQRVDYDDVPLNESSINILKNSEKKDGYINGIVRAYVKYCKNSRLDEVLGFDEDISDDLNSILHKILIEGSNSGNPNRIAIIYELLSYIGKGNQNGLQGKFDEVKQGAIDIIKKEENCKETPSEHLISSLKELTAQEIYDQRIDVLAIFDRFNPTVWDAKEILGHMDASSAINFTSGYLKSLQEIDKEAYIDLNKRFQEKLKNIFEDLRKKSFEATDSVFVDLIKDVIDHTDEKKLSKDSISDLWKKCIDLDWKVKDKSLIALISTLSKKVDIDDLLLISKKLADLKDCKNKSLVSIGEKLVDSLDPEKVPDGDFYNICKISYFLKGDKIKKFDDRIFDKIKNMDPYFVDSVTKAIECVNEKKLAKDSISDLWKKCMNVDWGKNDESLIKLLKTILEKCTNEEYLTEADISNLWKRCVDFNWGENDNSLITLLKILSEKVGTGDLLLISKKLAGLSGYANENLISIGKKLVDSLDLKKMEKIPDENFCDVCKVSYEVFKKTGLIDEDRAKKIDRLIIDKIKSKKEGFTPRLRIPYFFSMKGDTRTNFLKTKFTLENLEYLYSQSYNRNLPQNKKSLDKKLRFHLKDEEKVRRRITEMSNDDSLKISSDFAIELVENASEKENMMFVIHRIRYCDLNDPEKVKALLDVFQDCEAEVKEEIIEELKANGGDTENGEVMSLLQEEEMNSDA